jgi:uncharacterized protein (TIGR02246 family)
MKRAFGMLLLAVVGVLAVVAAGGYLAGQQQQKKEGERQRVGKDKEAPKETGTEKADADAIRKAGQSFVKAFAAGDAKALAALWTENGEYTADDGTTLRGRAEIRTAYEKQFAKRKGQVTGKIEVTSIRFPSKDTAIEEGYFESRAGKEAPAIGRYSVLHVREGGGWLMAVVREWPHEGASLRDLAWLIGSWQAKRDEVEVSSKYEWWGEDKAFIRAEISISQKGRGPTSGFQMIGRDASTGQLRSWTFDREGSFAQATWSREGGNKWVQEVGAGLRQRPRRRRHPGGHARHHAHRRRHVHLPGGAADAQRRGRR